MQHRAWERWWAGHVSFEGKMAEAMKAEVFSHEKVGDFLFSKTTAEVANKVENYTDMKRDCHFFSFPRTLSKISK